MPTMLDSVDPNAIRMAIANGAHPDALLGYSDGRFADYAAIAAEAGGLPVYALDVFGQAAGASGEDTEPGNIDPAGAAACLAAEKERGVDRPIGYCPESWAGQMVAEAAAHGLSGSTSAAGRADWRLMTAHYGRGPHICGPSTCGCPVEANGTQWADSGPREENVDQSLLDATFIAAASHPGPPPAPAPPPPPVHVGPPPPPYAIGDHVQAVPFNVVLNPAGWTATDVILPAGMSRLNVVSVVLDWASGYDPQGWQRADASVDFANGSPSPNVVRVVVNGPPNGSFTGRVFAA